MGIPCGWVSGGFASRTTAKYSAAGNVLIGLCQPTDVLVQAFSPNGPGANYLTVPGMRWAIQVQAYDVDSIVVAARAVGARIFMVTGIPCSTVVLPPNAGVDFVIDDQRKAYNARRIAAAKNDIVMLYHDRQVSDGGVPGVSAARILPMYDAGDGTHTNSLASTAYFVELMAAVKSVHGLP
jgi:hypothetical protein